MPTLQALDELVIPSSFPMVSSSRLAADSTSKTTRGIDALVAFGSRAAIDPDVGTPDLAGLGFDAAVAGERPASASAELVAQVSEHVDDDVVVHVARTRHHAQRKPIHELVAVRLELLPGEDSSVVQRRGAASVISDPPMRTHVSQRRGSPESPQEALPLTLALSPRREERRGERERALP